MLSIQQLQNGEKDLNHVADFATTKELVVTDRNGNTKPSLHGVIADLKAFNMRGLWSALTVYKLKDVVSFGGFAYAAVLDHTSSVSFSTDTAKWAIYQGVTLADLSNSVDNTKGAALIGYKGRSLASRLEDMGRNVREYGELGSGDNSATIQKAIDEFSLSGGGELQLNPREYKANIILKDGVTLVGSRVANPGISWGSRHPVQIVGFTTDTVIDTPVSEMISCGLAGISISGKDYQGEFGVRLRHVNGGVFSNLGITGTLNEGFITAGVANTIQRIIVTDALKNRNRTDRAGAVTIDGADHWVYGIECQVGNQNYGNSLSSPDRFLTGLYVKGANHFLTSCIGELSDVGIVVDGAEHSLVGCRGDLNNGEGFIVNGSAQLSACRSVNNSRGYDGQFSGFVATGQGAQFTSCKSVQSNGSISKYGFEDLTQFTDLGSRNIFNGCSGIGYKYALYNISRNKPSLVMAAGGGINRPLSGGDEFIDVDDSNVIYIYEAGVDSVISKFIGGYPGQRITLITDVLTKSIKIANSWYTGVDGIRTNNEPSFLVLSSKRSYSFLNLGNFWVQD